MFSHIQTFKCFLESLPSTYSVTFGCIMLYSLYYVIYALKAYNLASFYYIYLTSNILFVYIFVMLRMCPECPKSWKFLGAPPAPPPPPPPPQPPDHCRCSVGLLHGAPSRTKLPVLSERISKTANERFNLL